MKKDIFSGNHFKIPIQSEFCKFGGKLSLIFAIKEWTKNTNYQRMYMVSHD